MKRKKKKKQEPQKSSIKGYIIGLIACIPFLLFGAAMIKLSVTEISYTIDCTAETTGTVGEVSVKSEKKRTAKAGVTRPTHIRQIILTSLTEKRSMILL